MKPASVETMELGNLLFGNSRGEYLVEPREEYQEPFQEFLRHNNFDSYGIRYGCREFENDTFIMRPYYWGEDEVVAALPNFVYKPLGLEIKWYKYPMRDAYSNMDISVEDFKIIMKDCDVSMKGNAIE